MSLTVGTGPFGPRNTGTFNFDTGALKEHTLYLQESPKRVRATFNGETVVDSRRAKLLHETKHLPVYYFPEEDVRTDLLVESDHTTHCPFKGDTYYRSKGRRRRSQRTLYEATQSSWSPSRYSRLQHICFQRVSGPVCTFPHGPVLYLQIGEKAERVGFEPTRRLNTAYAISSPKDPIPPCPDASG